jgi:acyl-CoA thioesterase FadM
MNLWIRLFVILISARWRDPTGLFDTTRLRMMVLPNDLDFNGHVTNGRYLTLADLGRIDYVSRTGVLGLAMKRRAKPVIGDVFAKFRRGLKPFERYELHTRLLGWNEKWIFTEHQFVRRGQLVGLVVTRGLFHTAAGAMPPQEFLDALTIVTSSPPLPDWVASWNETCDSLSVDLRLAENAGPVKV